MPEPLPASRAGSPAGPPPAAAKARGLIYVAVALVLGVGVAQLPLLLAHALPQSWEKQLAKLLTPRLPLWRPGVKQAAAADALQVLVRRLYPLTPDDQRTPMAVHLVCGDTLNAFATFNGQIYVYSGLVQEMQSAEELVAVLAHEMEHVRRRHVVQNAGVQLLTDLLLKSAFGASLGRTAQIFGRLQFSRGQEREADEGAIRRLRDAHVDLAGMVDFFTRKRPAQSLPVLLSDHPADRERAARARLYLHESSTPVLDQKAWQALQKACQ